MNAKTETKFACNRFFFFSMMCGAITAWMSSVMFSDGDIGVGIGFAVFAVIFIGVPGLFIPFGYWLDRKGVTLCYLFVPSERFLWKNVRSIEVDYDRRGPTTFKLEGRAEGKHYFYMEGKIHKNRRTKRLLENYWDGTITGYFFENIHNWWRKRKKNKAYEIRQHIADEIIPMERTTRAEARAALALHDAQAAQLGLKLRIKFSYTTEDLEELKDRPEQNYTYTVLTELCHPGEKDEKRIITTSADLLHVRLGKTALRGVKDEDALAYLQQELTEVLQEVAKHGIDAYCQEYVN